MTNAEAWFSIYLRPRKPEGSLGRTAHDGHLDFHTAPEYAVWEIEGCTLSQRHYTTGTANSLRAETEWPREQATIKQASETSGLCRAVTGCRAFDTATPSFRL